MKKVKRKKPRILRNLACDFCEGSKEPSYKDYLDLKKYLNIRGGILSRNKTGICAKHQRQTTQSIKRARHLSLLPFVTSA
ncbi:MAG: 30S ribosomal protein S18 [Candidatus Shapirobacteria bacterium]